MKKPWRKHVPVEGGPLTPLALRQIAGWLDLGDQAFAAIASLQGMTYTPEANSVAGDRVFIQLPARTNFFWISPLTVDEYLGRDEAW